MKSIFLFLVLSLFALPSISETSPKEYKYKIGIIQNHVFIDMYQLTYEQAMIAALERYPNFEATIMDSEGNIELQKKQIAQLIKSKVNAIILWPVHGRKIVESVQKAHAANIPVIISNSNIHKTGYQFISAYSGPDNTLEGEYAAEILCDRLKQLNLETEARIVEIMGVSGYTTAIERSTGFRNRLKDECPQASIIDADHGNWSHKEGFNVMKKFLQRHETIHAVFSGDDNMGTGALRAAKEANRHKNIIFVGATNFAAGYEAMAAGEYWGSVYQSPVLDAENALKTTLDVLKMKKNQKFFNHFKTPKITQENMKEFVKPLF